ncbi:hypothetical protein DH86_00003097, partial [Scytalidium sp. 3C]
TFSRYKNARACPLPVSSSSHNPRDQTSTVVHQNSQNHFLSSFAQSINHHSFTRNSFKMKSFLSTAVVLSVAALAQAQNGYHYNSDGSITCDTPNAVYCAGGSGSTNIIIRCKDVVGQAGNCNDNLDGYPPIGSSGATCWSNSTGVAACAKSGIVYGSSGNFASTFPIPGSASSSGSSAASSAAPSSSAKAAAGGAGESTVFLTSTATEPCG